MGGKTNGDVRPFQFDRDLRADDEGMKAEEIDGQIHLALCRHTTFPITTRIVSNRIRSFSRDHREPLTIDEFLVRRQPEDLVETMQRGALTQRVLVCKTRVCDMPGITHCRRDTRVEADETLDLRDHVTAHVALGLETP